MNPAPPVTNAFMQSSLGSRTPRTVSPAAIDTFSPRIERSSTDAPAPTSAPGPMIESRTRASGPMWAPAITTEPDTCAPASTAAFGPITERDDRRRLRDHGAQGRSATRVGGALAAIATVDDVELRLQVRLGRARVEPVGAAVVEREQPAVRDQRRERLALDRHAATGVDAVEHRRLEHVQCRR